MPVWPVQSSIKSAYHSLHSIHGSSIRQADLKELQKRSQLGHKQRAPLAPSSPRLPQLDRTLTQDPAPPTARGTVRDMANAFGSCIFKCAWKYPCSSCEYFRCCSCFCYCFRNSCILHVLVEVSSKNVQLGGVANNYCIKFFAARLLLTCVATWPGINP